MTFDFAKLMEGFVEAQCQGGIEAGVAFMEGAKAAIDAQVKPEPVEQDNEPHKA